MQFEKVYAYRWYFAMIAIVGSSLVIDTGHLLLQKDYTGGVSESFFAILLSRQFVYN